MPHGHCYLWQPSLVWTHSVTDTVIGLAYVGISLTLFAMVKKIHLPFTPVVMFFGIFIGACGLTHFMEVWTLWNPDYWASAFVKVVTAIASVGTGVFLFRMRSSILTVAEAAKLSEQKRLDLEALTEDLEARVQERTAELEKSEQNFKTVANSIPQLAWMTDKDGYILWYNQRWYNYTGTTLEEMRGWGWKMVHHPDFTDKVTEKWLQCLRDGSDWEDTFPLRGKDGKYRWFLSRALPVRDEKGEILHWFGTNTDITEQRQIEQELKESKEFAEKANQAKSQFLANMSHEIRTPLTSILGFSDLINEPSFPLEEQQEFKSAIQRNARHLSEIVDDILDLAKIEAGELQIETIAYPLETLKHDLFSLVGGKAQSKGLDFKIEVASGVPGVLQTDSTKLKQILVNILGNAIKFTTEGFVKLRISAGDDMISFEVEDTGIGISTEDSQKLFRPFSQADDSFTRRFGGTGLGLTLSRHLARALGGDVILKQSEPQKGSLFVITISNRALSLEKPEASLSAVTKSNR